MEHLQKTFGNKIGQLFFMNSEITYYNKYDNLISLSAEKAVFCKPEIFSPEAEHRVAIFYPTDKPGFNTQNGDIIPFRSDSESMHMQSFANEGNSFWKGIVEGSFEHQT